MSWVQKGGTLIAVGPFSLKNEFGLDLAHKDSIYRTLFPKFQQVGSGHWDYSVDGTAHRTQPFTANSFGKGRVVCLNQSLNVLMQDSSLNALLTEIVRDVCERTASSPSSDLEILVREGSKAKSILVCATGTSSSPLRRSSRLPANTRIQWICWFQAGALCQRTFMDARPS